MKENSKHQEKASSKAGSIAQVGALLSAVLTSVCCWLPLVLLVFGVSGGTMAAKFEAFRPLLLAVTFTLLGLAFFFTYRKPKVLPAADMAGKEACGCGPEHAKATTIKTVNKAVLWVVTVFVLAFAFFPDYLGFLLAGNGTAQLRADAERVEWRMTIKGMSCQGCAARIESKLREVPGTLEAKVDYKQGSALITTTPQVKGMVLQEAVEVAGYSVGSLEHTSEKQGGTQ